ATFQQGRQRINVAVRIEQRKVAAETAALTRSALHLYPATHHFHQLLANDEPETAAAIAARSAGIALRKGNEQLRDCFFAHADTAVGDREEQPWRICRTLNADLEHDATVLGELERIVQQVQQYLLESGWIATDS